MTEKDLKDALVHTMRTTVPWAVVFRHEDTNTAGIPDIAFTYKGKTIWLEVKYANPYIRSRGLQDLTCLRLASQGFCWHIIYQENKGERRTIIAQPKHVVEAQIFPDECMAPGFDHEFVVHFIRRICGDYH